MQRFNLQAGMQRVLEKEAKAKKDKETPLKKSLLKSQHDRNEALKMLTAWLIRRRSLCSVFMELGGEDDANDANGGSTRMVAFVYVSVKHKIAASLSVTDYYKIMRKFSVVAMDEMRRQAHIMSGISRRARNPADEEEEQEGGDEDDGGGLLRDGQISVWHVIQRMVCDYLAAQSAAECTVRVKVDQADPNTTERLASRVRAVANTNRQFGDATDEAEAVTDLSDPSDYDHVINYYTSELTEKTWRQRPPIVQKRLATCAATMNFPDAAPAVCSPLCFSQEVVLEALLRSMKAAKQTEYCNTIVTRHGADALPEALGAEVTRIDPATLGFVHDFVPMGHAATDLVRHYLERDTQTDAFKKDIKTAIIKHDLDVESVEQDIREYYEETVKLQQAGMEHVVDMKTSDLKEEILRHVAMETDDVVGAGLTTDSKLNVAFSDETGKQRTGTVSIKPVPVSKVDNVDAEGNVVSSSYQFSTTMSTKVKVKHFLVAIKLALLETIPEEELEMKLPTSFDLIAILNMLSPVIRRVNWDTFGSKLIQHMINQNIEANLNTPKITYKLPKESVCYVP